MRLRTPRHILPESWRNVLRRLWGFFAPVWNALERLLLHDGFEIAGFMAFSTLPVAQARICLLIPYGFVNNAAAKLLPPERVNQLPTAPQFLEQGFIRDIPWWVDNTQAVTDRWNEWILE